MSCLALITIILTRFILAMSLALQDNDPAHARRDASPFVSLGDCKSSSRLRPHELTTFSFAVDDMGSVVLVFWDLLKGPVIDVSKYVRPTDSCRLFLKQYGPICVILL